MNGICQRSATLPHLRQRYNPAGRAAQVKTAQYNLENPTADLQLFNAVKTDDLQNVIGALQQGANVNAQDEYGMRPLHSAAEHNLSKIAQLLIIAGANVNAQSKDGKSPLHLAMRYSNLSVCVLLYTNGADMHLADRNGLTPLNEASDPALIEQIHWEALHTRAGPAQQNEMTKIEDRRNTTANTTVHVLELEKCIVETNKRCEELAQRCALLSSQLCDVLMQHDRDVERANYFALAAIAAAIAAPTLLLFYLSRR